MNNCPRCGVQTVESARFCNYCGANLDSPGQTGVQAGGVPPYHQRHQPLTPRGPAAPTPGPRPHQAVPYAAHARPAYSRKATASLIMGVISFIIVLAILSTTYLILAFAFTAPDYGKMAAYFIALISLFFFAPSIVFHLTALVLGIQAIKDIKSVSEPVGGKWGAVAGAVFGSIGLLALALFLIAAAIGLSARP